MVPRLRMINSETSSTTVGPVDRAHCRNMERITWTYNQGVIWVAWLNSTRLIRSRLREIASSIALAAIAHLTANQGVLHETSPLIRAVTSRSSKHIRAQPHDLEHRPSRSPLSGIVRANALASGTATGMDRSLGFWWQPFDSADAARQSRHGSIDAADALHSDQ